VYEELKKLAAQKMAQESPGQTLQATVLVHEAYLRLVGNGQPQDWNGRGHFFAAATEAMRRILAENVRRKGHEKHDGGRLELLAGQGYKLAVVAFQERLSRSGVTALECRNPAGH
jgi:hypothetical protein